MAQAGMKLALVAVACALLQLARGVAVITTDIYYNFGAQVCITYDATDGYDGRSSVTAATQFSYDEYNTTSGEMLEERQQYANDWIGFYPEGACKTGQDRHQCYISYATIPKSWRAAGQWTGQHCFQQKEYKKSGTFEIRYFYGDDPHIDHNCTSDTTTQDYTCYSAHYHWDGNGYVCNTNAGVEGYVLPMDDPTPCTCNPDTGNATEDATCTKNRAACQVCSLDSAASATIYIMKPFGYSTKTTQASVGNSIKGLEIHHQ